MTKGEALKKMQAVKAYMTSGNPIWDVTEIGEAFGMAIEALEQQEQHWIPCSERLPEKADGKYWVCTDTEYQCQCRWTDNVYGLGSNGEWAWKIFDIPQYSHVVAWMPLPEPWRGGEDG